VQTWIPKSTREKSSGLPEIPDLMCANLDLRNLLTTFRAGRLKMAALKIAGASA